MSAVVCLRAFSFHYFLSGFDVPGRIFRFLFIYDSLDLAFDRSVPRNLALRCNFLKSFVILSFVSELQAFYLQIRCVSTLDQIFRKTFNLPEIDSK